MIPKPGEQALITGGSDRNKTGLVLERKVYGGKVGYLKIFTGKKTISVVETLTERIDCE